MIDGRRDPRLHGQKRGRQVAHRSVALPSPALEPALAAGANRTRAVLAQPERDPEASMAIWALIDQHPAMRRADAALGQEPARPTIAVMAMGPIGVETGETNGRRGLRRG